MQDRLAWGAGRQPRQFAARRGRRQRVVVVIAPATRASRSEREIKLSREQKYGTAEPTEAERGG